MSDLSCSGLDLRCYLHCSKCRKVGFFIRTKRSGILAPNLESLSAVLFLALMPCIEQSSICHCLPNQSHSSIIFRDAIKSRICGKYCELMESSARKPIPRRLEEELNSIPKFKPRVEPTRRTVADILGDSAERAAYDEILGPLINRRSPSLSKISTTGFSNKLATAVSSATSSESDFTTTLLNRLADAEEETKSMRKQLVEKIKKLSIAERENAELRAVVDAPSHLIDELNHYKTENFNLEKQIVDMEEFLHDYGLEWVGHKNASGGDKAEETEAKSSSDRLNYQEFCVKIEELNNLLSSEPSQVKTDTEGKRARIVHASELFDSIRVTFYNDGIMIRRGPFREWNSPSYSSFVRDIMDGFFPSEFRDEFPDGVMFHLVDRHTIVYLSSKDRTDGALGRDEFLGKLQKTVLKNGNIVSVRQDIADFIDNKGSLVASADAKLGSVSDNVSSQGKSGGGKGGPIILQTRAFLLKEESKNSKESSERSASTGNVLDYSDISMSTASVQIRWLNGSILVAVMFLNDTVGSIREEIIAHTKALQDATRTVAESDYEAIHFELRSAYPPRILLDSMSLEEAELIPNGTVHARRI